MKWDDIPEPERNALMEPLIIWLCVISALFLLGLQQCSGAL